MHEDNQKIRGPKFENRWWRFYRIEGATTICESKFANDEIAISLDELERQWGSWGESEQLSFVSAYVYRPEGLPEDVQILDFLMQTGSERVWANIAGCLLRHPNRNKVRNFLLERLRSSLEGTSNFIKALGIIGGSEVISELRKFHDQALHEIKNAGKENDWELILQFMYCCSSLRKLEDRNIYDEEINSFCNHDNEIVRNTVVLLLATP